MPSTLLSPIIDTNSNALLQDFDVSSQNYKCNRLDSLYHGFTLAKTRNFTDFSTNLAIQHQLALFSTSNDRKRVP
jgi:hypothetical protein